MPAEIRDNREDGTVVHSGQPPYIYPLIKGNYKAINSVRTGKFVPGIFRVNPVSIEQYTVESDTSFFESITYPPGSVSGDVIGAMNKASIPWYTPWNTTKASYVIQKAYGKLNGVDFEGAAALAELKDTLSMLRHPLEGLVKLLKNGNPKKVPALTGSLWLQYRYGILPLISDIEALLDIYRKGLRDIGVLKSYRATESYVTTDVKSGMAVTGNLYFDLRTVKEVTDTYTCVVYCKYLTQLSQAQRWGVDLRSLPVAAWEAIPYSFIVDWFYGIGDWLSSMRVNSSVSVLGNCVSLKQSGTIVATGTNPVWGPYRTRPKGSNSPGKQACTYSKLERRCNLPAPTMPVRNLSDLGFLRSLDSLCLTLQRIKISK